MQVEGSLGTNLPLQNKCKEYSNTYNKTSSEMLVHRVQISKKVSDAQDFYPRHSISPRDFRKYRCFNASTTSHLLVILHNMIMHESKLYKKSFPKLFEM